MENWAAKKLNAIISIGEGFNIEEFLLKNNKEGGKEIEEGGEPKGYSEHNVESIMTMGFSANAAARALIANQDNVEVACSWLYEHIDDANINEPLTKPSKSNAPPSDLVNQILDFGFTH